MSSKIVELYKAWKNAETAATKAHTAYATAMEAEMKKELKK